MPKPQSGHKNRINLKIGSILIDSDSYAQNRKRQYKVKAFLGVGGFATVYELESEASGQRYAGKIVDLSKINAEAKRKVIQEFEIHRSLDHPSIVKCYRGFNSGGYYVFLLELCSAYSLMELSKRRGPLSEPEAQCMLWQILQGLAYLRQNNIIHRDLKLGNIFLDENMRVKIGDFGLATFLNNPADRKKTFCGTPNYMAPEMLQNPSRPDFVGCSFEIDIWAYGVIAYVLLFGRPPFETTDLKSTYSRIKQLQFTFPESNVSAQGCQLILSIFQLENVRISLYKLSSHPFFTCSPFPQTLPTSIISIPYDFVHLSRQDTPPETLPFIPQEVAPIEFLSPAALAAAAASTAASLVSNSIAPPTHSAPPSTTHLPVQAYHHHKPHSQQPQPLSHHSAMPLASRPTHTASNQPFAISSYPKTALGARTNDLPVKPPTTYPATAATHQHRFRNHHQPTQFQHPHSEAQPNVSPDVVQDDMTDKSVSIPHRQLSHHFSHHHQQQQQQQQQDQQQQQQHQQQFPHALAPPQSFPVSYQQHPHRNHQNAGPQPLRASQQNLLHHHHNNNNQHHQHQHHHHQPVVPSQTAMMGHNDDNVASAHNVSTAGGSSYPISHAPTRYNTAGASATQSSNQQRFLDHQLHEQQRRQNKHPTTGASTRTSPSDIPGLHLAPPSGRNITATNNHHINNNNNNPKTIAPLRRQLGAAAAPPPSSSVATLRRTAAAISSATTSQLLPTSHEMATVSPEHKSVWVSFWFNYSERYGLGYILSNGSCGVCFNDTTSIILHPDGINCQYICNVANSREKKSVSSASSSSSQSSTFEISHYIFHHHPEHLNKKALLLHHFLDFLTAHCCDATSQAPIISPNGDSLVPSEQQQQQQQPAPFPGCSFWRDFAAPFDVENATRFPLPFVKSFTNDRSMLLIRLSNRTTQILFNNNISTNDSKPTSNSLPQVQSQKSLLGELLIDTQHDIITFTDMNHQRHYTTTSSWQTDHAAQQNTAFFDSLSHIRKLFPLVFQTSHTRHSQIHNGDNYSHVYQQSQQQQQQQSTQFPSTTTRDDPSPSYHQPAIASCR